MTLLKKIRSKLQKQASNDVIVQFSPPRSGSTLLYNILRDLFPDKTIDKTHQYKTKFSKHQVVVTHRHPLDCIASGIQRYGKKPSDAEIINQIKDFDENGIWDLLSIKSLPNVLMLRYESFYGNFEYLFDNLETYFSISITDQQRAAISSEYDINAVYQSVKQFDDFHEYDSDRHWHGNHISEYKGKIYYYKQFFTKDQVDYLKTVYKDILVAFSYD